MIAIGIPNGMEWLIILVVILLLFGHRLPTMARSLGSGITEFKRGLKEGAQKDGSSKTDDRPSDNRPSANGPSANGPSANGPSVGRPSDGGGSPPTT